MNGSTQTIHYHHKDHLGSVRAVTDTSSTVIEQNAYYPFGGRHTFSQTYTQTTSNRYKFNGKEQQTIGNIGLLDYGARMYDTKIARWLVQDPLAEKYYPFSSYSFSGNNPIMNIDRDGQAWDVFIDVASLVYDVGSAIYNHAKGNHSQAKQNWVDVGVDVVSMVVPGLAAPVAKGIIKGADKVVDVGKSVENIGSIKDIPVGKYSEISSPKNAAPGKKTTPNQRKKILIENMRQHDGVPISDGDGRVLNLPSQNIKGKKADMNQAEIDHIIPKSKGASNHNANLQVLSKEENLRKANKLR